MNRRSFLGGIGGILLSSQLALGSIFNRSPKYKVKFSNNKDVMEVAAEYNELEKAIITKPIKINKTTQFNRFEIYKNNVLLFSKDWQKGCPIMVAGDEFTFKYDLKDFYANV